MDGNSSAGSTPKMDWLSADLPSAWKAFKQHCEFTFGGPLKQKSEEVKCNYLMLWVGDKGREIYRKDPETKEQPINKTWKRKIKKDDISSWSEQNNNLYHS
ncbi:hypothetical protein P5673_007606, partial [Acropora cervicornis]